ncbi:MAG: tetratricopeptide repeat protein [Candidatus Zixiibacteriota bacterium]
MKKLALMLMTGILLFLILVPNIQAVTNDGVQFELIVRQKPEAVDRYFEITRDTIDAPVGKNISTFLVNMTVDISIESADSQSVTFNSHLVTIGSNPYNIAKRFRIEFNLPARFENIPGKNGSVYQLLISPRQRVQIEGAQCDIEPDDRYFKMDPSANFDLYYVEGSLGDFNWNSIKNYLEADYTRFRKAFDVNSPGKISFYLCPCAVETVHWDKRFGYAIDPGRAVVYTLYHHNFSSVDVILPNMLTLLRLHGYAPPFMVEGLAGYFDFVPYNIQKLKKEQPLPNIKDLLTTSGYYGTDPITAEICASAFLRFLADQYGITRAMKWYERSDDLTILRALEEVFQKPIDTLEKEWHYCIDTTTFDRTIFDYYASRANALYQSDKQIEYIKQMTHYDQTGADSVDTWKKLSVTYYQYGHYYDAIDGYKRLIRIDGRNPLYYQILGNLFWINGEYDNALTYFDTVLTLDTTYATAGLMLAKITAMKGDTAKAIKMAEDYYNIEQNISGKMEFMLFLGEMYGSGGKNYDSARADGYYSDALIWAREMIPQAPEDPIFRLRAGLALMGLGQYDEARQYLELCSFIELRTFYLGLIKLSLGKLADLQGNHAEAIEHYRDALSVPLAEYHRKLCEQYIEKPFKR